MNIDKTKSLEELENDYWGEEDTYQTSLIETIYKLRKKPLDQLEPGDIRYFIGQHLGNKYIVPIALNILEKNPYILGTYYEGDLLNGVLDIEVEFWKENKELFGQLVKIMEKFNNDFSEEIEELITNEEKEAFNNKWIYLSWKISPNEIDFAFISRVEAQQQLIGKVPQQNGIAVSQSGVTIATNFDIGQHNFYDLRQIFGIGPENVDLITLYTPYIILKGEEAMLFLRENPLRITQAQADRTDAAVMSQNVSRIASNYNTATGGNFIKLSDQAQTVVFSLGYHPGPDGISNEILTSINEGNYSEAATAIQDMRQRSGYADRGRQEADLLRQA
jgi:hypothetical protein